MTAQTEDSITWGDNSFSIISSTDTIPFLPDDYHMIIAPIKQNGSVMIIIFGTWIISLAMAGVWLFIAYEIGAAAYLAILCVLFGAAGLFFLHWLDTKGARHFAGL